jgi:hypothetical protein
MPFLQEHPLIRPLSVYQALVPDCFAADGAASSDTPNPHQPMEPNAH